MAYVSEQVEDLKALQKAAEDACQAAIAAKTEIGGAINWADLHCAEARWFINHQGESGQAVYIEEASHDSSKLIIFIRDFLYARGFAGVEIYPEW